MSIRWLTVSATLALLLVLASFLRTSQPKPGETPLMLAASRGDTKLVESLLAQGADAHITSPDGKNAMDYATLGGVCQLQTVIALKQRVPDLQLHEPSPFWRNVEIAKIKGCAGLRQLSHLW